MDKVKAVCYYEAVNNYHYVNFYYKQEKDESHFHSMDTVTIWTTISGIFK